MTRIIPNILAAISAMVIGLPLLGLAVESSGTKGEASPVKDTIHVVGHAHMDMNWLWTYSETMKMANDNLRQTVAFMEEFPDFTMLQSQGCGV